MKLLVGFFGKLIFIAQNKISTHRQGNENQNENKN